MAEIFSKDAQETSDAEKEKPAKSPDQDISSINDGLLDEGFLSAEFVEELISELPLELATPPEIPRSEKPKISDILGRRRVKSESFVLLMDPRRPGLAIELANDAYSKQILNEKQYKHLDADMQGLISHFVDIPFAAAVADTEWQNPPNFTFLYTIISDREEKDRFNAIFADRAFLNKGINFRALSVELRNLPQILTQDLHETMDIADVEILRNHIEEIIDKLLAADATSEVYQSILTEMEKMEELSEEMLERITELVSLVKKVEVENGVEELCMVEFDYPTWEPRETWNYLNPSKLLKRRKYRKLLQAILVELKEYIPQNKST